MNSDLKTDRGEFRDLKATLSLEEFGAIKWAAANAGRPPKSAMPLDEFLRSACLEQVRTVVRVEIERGKGVPAAVAAVVASMARRNPS